MRYAFKVIARILGRDAGARGMTQTRESAWRILQAQPVTCRVTRIRVSDALYARLPR